MIKKKGINSLKRTTMVTLKEGDTIDFYSNI